MFEISFKKKLLINPMGKMAEVFFQIEYYFLFVVAKICLKFSEFFKIDLFHTQIIQNSYSILCS